MLQNVKKAFQAVPRAVAGQRALTTARAAQMPVQALDYSDAFQLRGKPHKSIIYVNRPEELHSFLPFSLLHPIYKRLSLCPSSNQLRDSETECVLFEAHVKVNADRINATFPSNNVVL